MKYPRLFSPVRVGPKELKNRIWMTAHSAAFSKGQNAEAAYLGYYGERAAHEVGAITVPFHQELVDLYPRLLPAVRSGGCLLLQQLWHPGRQSDSMIARSALWSASAIPDTVFHDTPHEMTSRDIAAFLDLYERQSMAAVNAGLDGVEIHGVAHGYLIGQFLSPATNHRTDAYGGSFENRCRLLLEVCERVRACVPSSMMLGIRINGDDGAMPGSNHLDEWRRIAHAVAASGRLDYVSVSHGTYWHTDRISMYATPPTAEGFQVPLAASIREALGGIPVVTVGRIMTPRMAEDILEEGKADLIGMTRSLIADAEWGSKAQSDRAEDIRPCVGLNLCIGSTAKYPMACVVNPAVGRENELGVSRYKRVDRPRRVAVVGGGPAGLRAALTAAWRGHEVTLYEAERELGGQVRWFASVRSYENIRGAVDWLAAELAKTSARIEVGRHVTHTDLLDADFDVVIVATGSTPLRHGWSSLNPAKWYSDEPVPGVDQPNVVTLREVFRQRFELQGSVLIFDDLGDRRAPAVAEYFAGRRHQVEIVTPMLSVARDLESSRDQLVTLKRLRSQGVTLTTHHDLREIRGEDVVLCDVLGDDTATRSDVGMVVLITGNQANDDVWRQLDGTALEARAAGDCIAPRRLFDAIWEGELAGRAV